MAMSYSLLVVAEREDRPQWFLLGQVPLPQAHHEPSYGKVKTDNYHLLRLCFLFFSWHVPLHPSPQMPRKPLTAE